jgi:hypothetical protein
MALVSTVFAAWLGSMFLYSSSLKLADQRRLGQEVVNYRLLPTSVARVVGQTLPWIELLTASILLARPAQMVGALLAVGLGSVFATASASALIRKIDVSCGCAGHARGSRANSMTVMRACTIITTGGVLSAGRAGPMPPALLGAIAAISLVPAMIALRGQRKVAQAGNAAAGTSSHEIRRLTDLLAKPLQGALQIKSD